MFSAKTNFYTSPASEFIEDQNNMLKILFKEIDDNSIFYDKAHNKWQSNSMSMLTLSQLFNREPESVKTGITYIRGQLHEGLNSHEKYIQFRIADVLSEAGPHFDETIYISRKTFEEAGTNYRYWPRLEYKEGVTVQQYENARFDFVDGKVEDTIQELIGLINAETGGVVEVSTLLNSYEESLGYQFLVPVEGYVGRDNKEFLAKFTIDTSQASDAENKLRYILKLMMTDDLVFLFTDSKPTITSNLVSFNKLYFAFNFRGFLSKDNIYSLMRTGRKKYAYYDNCKVAFSNQHLFDLGKYQDRWDHIWTQNYVFYNLEVFIKNIYPKPIMPYSDSFSNP